MEELAADYTILSKKCYEEMMMSKINVIDIGSVGGFDLPWCFHKDKIGKSLSFEPNEPTILVGEHLRYDSAIWDFDGEGKFYVSGPNGTGSSLLKQNYKWVTDNFDAIKTNGDYTLNNSWFERSNITHEFDCTVKKLDTVLKEIEETTQQKHWFHFLKSDTQSGESFILQGAETYLEKDCLGLDLELFRYPLYEGIITEEEVKNYLDKIGFYVAGWTGYQNSFNATSDYLFLRRSPRTQEEETIIAKILDIYNPQGKEKIIKRRTTMQKLTSRLKKIYSLSFS
jgi:hypothetical protein